MFGVCIRLALCWGSHCYGSHVHTSCAWEYEIGLGGLWGARWMMKAKASQRGEDHEACKLPDDADDAHIGRFCSCQQLTPASNNSGSRLCSLSAYSLQQIHRKAATWSHLVDSKPIQQPWSVPMGDEMETWRTGLSCPASPGWQRGGCRQIQMVILKLTLHTRTLSGPRAGRG